MKIKRNKKHNRKYEKKWEDMENKEIAWNK